MIWSLLNQEADPELPRNQIIQLVGKVCAKQCGVVLDLTELLLVKAARVHPSDEIERRDMRICAEGAAGNHIVPALIADIDPERGALGAKWAIAEIADA